MDGFGSHTFQWVNAKGEQVWIKYHFKTDQGIQCLHDDEVLEVTGGNPEYHLWDLRDAIERGEFPSWTLKVQIMTLERARDYRFNPFDVPKIWSQQDFPLIEVGRMTLNRWPENYFAEVEQSAFDPSHFVSGIGPSPDKMLQGRLFGYGDAHRDRIGVNHQNIPVNSAKAAMVRTHQRDGLGTVGPIGGGSKNDELNSFDGIKDSGRPLYAGLDVSGVSGSYEWVKHPEDNDFVQAGNLYRLLDEVARARGW